MTCAKCSPLGTAPWAALICHWPERPGPWQVVDVYDIRARLKLLAVVGTDDSPQPLASIRFGTSTDAARSPALTDNVLTTAPPIRPAARIHVSNRVELETDWPRSIAAHGRRHYRAGRRTVPQ